MTANFSRFDNLAHEKSHMRLEHFWMIYT